MTTKQFFGMITRSDEVIAELLKKKEMSETFEPGAKIIVSLCLAIDAFFFVLAWLVVGLLALLAAAMGGVGFLLGILMGASMFMSPIGFVVNAAVGVAISLAYSAAFAYSADYLQEKLFQNKGGKQKQVFNLIPQATLPFVIFLVIPVLGWIVMGVGTLFNTYRVLKQVYQEKEWIRTGAVMVLAGFATSIGAWIVAFGLTAATYPLRYMDPFQGVIGSVVEKAGGFSNSAEYTPSPKTGETDKKEIEEQERWGKEQEKSNAASVSKLAEVLAIAGAGQAVSVTPSKVTGAPAPIKTVAKPKPKPKSAPTTQPTAYIPPTPVPTPAPQGKIQKQDVDNAVNAGKQIFNMFK